ncbi:M48 family metalloprotease [Gardnerella vaginalis]|nr:M48 family metalloprotease [Gardnerella vaginalis]
MHNDDYNQYGANGEPENQAWYQSDDSQQAYYQQNQPEYQQADYQQNQPEYQQADYSQQTDYQQPNYQQTNYQQTEYQQSQYQQDYQTGYQQQTNYQQDYQQDYQQQYQQQEQQLQSDAYQQTEYQSQDYYQQPQDAYQQPQDTYQQTQGAYQQSQGAYQQGNYYKSAEEISKHILATSYFSLLIPLAIVAILFLLIPFMILAGIITALLHIDLRLILLIGLAAIFALPALRLKTIWENPVQSFVENLPSDYKYIILHGRAYAIAQNLSREMRIPTPTIYISKIAANAFALRDDANSAIFISEDLADACNDDELRAILANEMIHLMSNECIGMTRTISLLSRIAYYHIKGLNSSNQAYHNTTVLKLFVKRTKLEPADVIPVLLRWYLIDAFACLVLLIIFFMAPILGTVLIVIGAILEVIFYSITLCFIAQAIFYRSIKISHTYNKMLQYAKSYINWSQENDIDLLTIKHIQNPAHLASALHKILKLSNTYNFQLFNVNLRDTYVEPVLLAGFNPYYIQSRTDINRFDNLCAMYPGLSSQFKPLRYMDPEEETSQEQNKNSQPSYGSNNYYANQNYYANNSYYANPNCFNMTYALEKVRSKFVRRYFIMRSLVFVALSSSFFPFNLLIGPLIGIVYELIHDSMLLGNTISSYLGKYSEPVRTGRLVELTYNMCMTLNMPVPEIYIRDCIKTDAFVLKDEIRSAIIFSSNLPLMATDEELNCVIASMLYQLQFADCNASSKLVLQVDELMKALKFRYYKYRYGGSKIAGWEFRKDKKFLEKHLQEIRNALCNYTRYKEADEFAAQFTGNRQAMLSIMNKINKTINSKDWESKMDTNKLNIDFDASSLIGFTFNDYTNCHMAERIQELAAAGGER